MSAFEAPATPSTKVEAGKPTIENPAMVSGLPLSSWSASSVGNTSQESPASSMSGDDTELDIPATQLEPTVCQDKCSNKTGHGFFRDLDVKKSIEADEVTGRGSSEGCSFERHGGKRRRALGTGVNSPCTTSPASDFEMCGGGFSRSPRHETFLENSHSTVNPRHCSTAVSSSRVALEMTKHPSGSESEPHGAGPMLDPISLEAQKMRDVGITGKEGFKTLMTKLGKIGWRYTNSLVTRLGSNTWIVKPGLKIAKARPGVEKFENPEAVEKYVQDVLRSDTSTFENLCEEMDEDSPQRVNPNEQSCGDDMEICQGSTLQTTYFAEDEETGVEPEHDIKESPAYEALQSALESLQPSNVPAVLKQRTEEYRKVFDFVSKSVRWSCGGSLYLCGCPGTGKTQTMTHVQDEVERRAAKVRL